MIDWDWTLGPLIQMVVFCLWCYNIYEGFVTLNPIFAWMAAAQCFWFIFAPWCISEYPKFLCDPFRWYSSLYGAINHQRSMASIGLDSQGNPL